MENKKVNLGFQISGLKICKYTPCNVREISVLKGFIVYLEFKFGWTSIFYLCPCSKPHITKEKQK